MPKYMIFFFFFLQWCYDYIHQSLTAGCHIAKLNTMVPVIIYIMSCHSNGGSQVSIICNISFHVLAIYLSFQLKNRYLI